MYMKLLVCCYMVFFVVIFLKVLIEWVFRRKVDIFWLVLLFSRFEYFLYVLRYLNEKLKIKIFLNFYIFIIMKNFKYMYMIKIVIVNIK